MLFHCGPPGAMWLGQALCSPGILESLQRSTPTSPNWSVSSLSALSQALLTVKIQMPAARPPASLCSLIL